MARVDGFCLTSEACAIVESFFNTASFVYNLYTFFFKHYSNGT